MKLKVLSTTMAQLNNQTLSPGSKELLSSPGERLRHLKHVLRFSHEKIKTDLDSLGKKLIASYTNLGNKLSIPEGTLRGWESGQRTLTEKGIKKCVAAYGKVGLNVSEEWLRDGSGEFPSLIGNLDLDILKLFSKGSKVFFSYLDKEERFTYISQDYNELFQLPVDKIIGKKLSELINAKSYKLQKPFLLQAYGGKEVHFEYPWEYKPNCHKMLRLYFSPDFNLKGQVKGIHSFLEELAGDVSNHNLECKNIHTAYNPAPDNNFDKETYFNVITKVIDTLDMEGINYDIKDITSLSETLYTHVKSFSGTILDSPAVLKLIIGSLRNKLDTTNDT